MITILANGRLVDCIGDEPLEDASVIVEDGGIKDVYSGKRRLPEGRVIDVGGRTILPGLTDAHMHPAITRVDIYAGFREPPIVIAVRMKEQLERILQGGFTTVRDMGVGNLAMKQAVESGLIKGPRVLICNHWLSQAGGVGDPSNRGDFSGLPKDDSLIAVGRIVDGADDARKAAREQFRAGADQLKIFTSSGPIKGGATQMGLQHLADDEIRAICEVADALGSYVGAHATNTLAIRRAIEGGVRAIEHGTDLTEEVAQMMKERGVFLVSTIAIAYLNVKYGKEWGATELFLEGMKGRVKVHTEAAALAHKVGVTICAGTDNLAEMCGHSGITFKLLTEAGLTPYETIKAATITNAKLFRMEDKIGSIEVGKWADIIVVDGHPDEDAGVLAEPDNVRLVMKEGEIFKSTL